VAIGLAVIAGIVALADPIRRRVRRQLPVATVTVALSVVALVAAAGATWTVVDAGHKGAKATWQSVEDDDDDGGGDDTGGDDNSGDDNSGPGGGG
jgi:hypothetical protein